MSESMRCFGKFLNDRQCDLCSAVDIQCYNSCKILRQEALDKQNLLLSIKSSCVYRKTCYDEYTPFDGCTKGYTGSGRFTPDCNPTLECTKRKVVTNESN